MNKISEVEEAKALMNEAINWSVMKWLREKKTVRKVADRANAALDSTIADMIGNWKGELRLAYDQLASRAAKVENSNLGSDAISMAKRLKHAQEEAKQAREDAENTFDEAEKQLSTTMAREGCRKAIHSWELHEHVIKLAEAGIAAKSKA
jgi:hypothetical protein